MEYWSHVMLLGICLLSSPGETLQTGPVNITETTGDFSAMICPEGSVIEELQAWAHDDDGYVTCVLPLADVDEDYDRELQTCKGQRDCSHLAVITGQTTYCPGAIFADSVDAITVEYQCSPTDDRAIVKTREAFGDMACPPGTVIAVRAVWAEDTEGWQTCRLPLEDVDEEYNLEIQTCNGHNNCSHVAVVTGQKVYCPESRFADYIDTIAVEYQCIMKGPEVRNITRASGDLGAMACPLGTGIEVLGSWGQDRRGYVTCVLPLEDVDEAFSLEIQTCNGHSNCSHVAVETGQKVYCPGSRFADYIDTIAVEYRCREEEV